MPIITLLPKAAPAAPPAEFSPTLIVEVAFGKNPLEVPSDSDYTDVSSYCRGVSIRRGRDHELARSQAGTATIRLNNTDRRFDPTNTASPYYPNVIPMRQIRIRASYLGVIYPLFYGFVEDWGQQWDPLPMNGTGDAECVAQAVDGFKVLSLFEVASGGVYEDAVLQDHPTSYWKLEEGAGSPVADDARNLNDLTVDSAQVTLGVTPSALVGVLGAADFGAVGNTPLRDAGATGWDPDLRSFFATFWIKVDAYPSAGNTAGLLSINDGTTNEGHCRLLLHDDGHLSYSYSSSLGVQVASTSAGFLTTGTWTHVAVKRASGTVAFWRNAAHVVDVVGLVGHSNAGTSTPTIVVGAAEDEAAPYFDGKLAHVAVWDNAGPVQTTERLQAHYAAKLQAAANDTVSNQIGAILDLAGWPAAQRMIDADSTTVMQPLNVSGSALESLLSIGEDTEQGLVQMTADGKVLFHSRTSVFGHTTSIGTLGDNPGDIAYQDITFRYDDQDLYTRVIAQAEGGDPQSTEEPAAVVKYGPRTLSKTGLKFASDTDVLDFSSFLGFRYSAPALRATSVTIPAATAANWPLLLARDTHHDKVMVRRTPPGGGAAILQGAHIEGLAWDVTPPYTWNLSFRLVPAWEDLFWIWNATNIFDTHAFAW